MHDAVSRLMGLSWHDAVSKPDFTRLFDVYDAGSQAHRDYLAKANIFIGDHGAGNAILFPRAFEEMQAPTHLTFNGSRNVLVIDANTGLHGHIGFESDGVAVIGGNQHTAHLSLQMYPGSTLLWGRGSRTYGSRIWVHGGRRLVVGDDCLFSDGIDIHTSDHHSIIDLDTYEQINDPADVVIGRHVWIGPNVSILKGATVGDGAILAARTLVRGTVPPAELWGGVPARALRRRVSWVDSHPADPEQIDQLRALVEGKGARPVPWARSEPPPPDLDGLEAAP